jgi:hypothetical protein
MNVFIMNHPANGRLFELQDLTQGAPLYRRYEKRTGRDSEDKAYHYFIVYTDSTEEGWGLIEYLNGKHYQGARITAREFIQRTPSSLPAADWDRLERRINPATSE